MHKLGSWEIEQFKTTGLPQGVQSAFTNITGDMTGADYQPVLYCGHQVVNGINHCILCLQRIIIPEEDYRLVKMIIHEDTDGAASLVSVSKVAL